MLFLQYLPLYYSMSNLVCLILPLTWFVLHAVEYALSGNHCIVSLISKNGSRTIKSLVCLSVCVSH
jgi:hypothetical protein